MTEISTMDEEQRRNHIGEKIYSLIEEWHGENAPRITGMIIDMETKDLMAAIESKSSLKKVADEGHQLLTQSPDE
jgi:polyadenylate-binding protein